MLRLEVDTVIDACEKTLQWIEDRKERIHKENLQEYIEEYVGKRPYWIFGTPYTEKDAKRKYEQSMQYECTEIVHTRTSTEMPNKILRTAKIAKKNGREFIDLDINTASYILHGLEQEDIIGSAV